MRLGLVLAVAVVACGDDGTARPDAPDRTERVDVVSVPAAATRDVDLLFVVDNSVSMADKQSKLLASFPNFINALDGLPAGRPNLHIGVVTSDLGTSSTIDPPGPNVGAPGMGGCGSNGDAGKLRTATAVSGAFISDTEASGGRATNYTGTLAGAFAALAAVGDEGCGFEQTLESAQRALDANDANAGFLRAGASLAVVILSDEDDCSLTHSGLLGPADDTIGPLTSFRCTRFGLRCTGGGADSDAMNVPGQKTECHGDTSGEWLTKVEDHIAFFSNLKTDKRQVMVAALVGSPAAVFVDLAPPPGMSVLQPTLGHACQYEQGTLLEIADPAVRIAQFATAFQHHVVSSVCSDLTPGLDAISGQLGNLLGSPCLAEPIAMPPDCTAIDEDASGVQTPLPHCPSAGDCFDVATDLQMCNAEPHLALKVTRVTPAAAGIVTTARCKL